MSRTITQTPAANTWERVNVIYNIVKSGFEWLVSLEAVYHETGGLANNVFSREDTRRNAKRSATAAYPWSEADRFLPGYEGAAVGPNEKPFVVEKNAPVVEENVPVVEENVPVVEKNTPVLEENDFAAEINASVVQKNAFVINENAPVVHINALVVQMIKLKV